MDPMLDLTLLSAFVAVAEAKSFSSAAKRLGVTTATMSRKELGAV
ncbi:LysR family transcriptional regulator [Pendulispora rubella]